MKGAAWKPIQSQLKFNSERIGLAALIPAERSRGNAMIATMRQDASSDALADNAYKEHLHLHMRRTHWETKHHTDLGPHLQDALDRLDEEGWEVVTAFTIARTPEIILCRRADGNKVSPEER
ncbi:MAG: hypothetical protein WCP07_03380 [bacterium]